MHSHRAALEAAFATRELEQLVALLDERVVWRGLPGADSSQDEQPGQEADEHDAEGHDHHHPPMCTSRDEVRDVLEQFAAGGGSGYPVVLAEAGDTVVVDPRPEPALGFPLHQAFTFRGGRVVLIQDYPDRESALADVKG